MDYFENYDDKFPDIIFEILDYFDTNNTSVNPNSKSVLDFCQRHGQKVGKEFDPDYQPEIVNRICEKLCSKSILKCIKGDGSIGIFNNYIFMVRDRGIFDSDRTRLKTYLNSIVFGFSYIYKLYKKKVFPIVGINKSGDEEVGTGFEYAGGIVTARHCIEDVSSVKINGYSAEELSKSSIYVSGNPGVDIAFIDVGRDDAIPVYGDNGEILQEVLVLGYPKIPAFTNFLTAEKATISSRAISRLTPTKGDIAAYGNEYLSKVEAMLITAKIKGGNSGGPVINADGSVVGIACHLPVYGEEFGRYDDLGYGIAVPFSYLSEIVSQRQYVYKVNDDFFQDYN